MRRFRFINNIYYIVIMIIYLKDLFFELYFVGIGEKDNKVGYLDFINIFIGFYVFEGIKDIVESIKR